MAGKKRKPKKLRFLAILIMMVALLILVHQSTWFQRKRFPMAYEKEILQYSKEFEIDPYLVVAVIYVESHFRADAVSSRGARGLMQIMPRTGKWAADHLKIKPYDDQMLMNPETNIKIGCWYLKKLSIQFKGKEQLVLAAYNGGSGNVNRWLASKDYSPDGKNLTSIPFKETQEYIPKVMAAHKMYKRLYHLE